MMQQRRILMSKIQKLHHFLNQNIIAKICLYALTLIQPILFYFSFAKNINVSSYSPYYFTWIGFYSCTVIIWAYHKKAWETILNIVLVVINLTPILFCCIGACMGGWLGLLWAMSTLTMPLVITMMFDGFIVKILECIGLVILLVVLVWGIRAFLILAANSEERLLKELEEKRCNL
jgi:hypothetical protein